MTGGVSAELLVRIDASVEGLTRSLAAADKALAASDAKASGSSKRIADALEKMTAKAGAAIDGLSKRIDGTGAGAFAKIDAALKSAGAEADRFTKSLSQVDTAKAAREAIGYAQSLRSTAEANLEGAKAALMGARANAQVTGSLAQVRSAMDAVRSAHAGVLSARTAEGAAIQRLADIQQNALIGTRNLTTAAAANDVVMRRNGASMLQLGAQAQDFAIQVAGGQNILLAAAQQGSQVAFLMGGFANTFKALGSAALAAFSVIASNPIIAMVTAIGIATTAFIALNKSTDEAAVSQAAYTAAVIAGTEADDNAALAADRKAKARQAEQRFDVRQSVNQEEANFALLMKQREAMERDLATLVGSFTDGVVPDQVLEPWIRSLEILNIQIRDATLRQLGLAEATEKVSDAGRLAREETARQVKAFADLEAEHVNAYKPDNAGNLARQKTILDALRQASDVYADAVRDVGIAQATTNLTTAEAARHLENLNNWLYQTAPAYEKVRAEVDKNAKAAADLETALEAAHKPDTAKILDERRKVIEALITPSERYEQSVERLNQLAEQGWITQDQLTRSVANLSQALYDSDPAYQAARRAAEDFDKAARKAAEHTTDRLVDFAADTLFDVLAGKAKSFWEGFKDLGLRAMSAIATDSIARPISPNLVPETVS